MLCEVLILDLFVPNTSSKVLNLKISQLYLYGTALLYTRRCFLVLYENVTSTGISEYEEHSEANVEEALDRATSAFREGATDRFESASDFSKSRARFAGRTNDTTPRR